MKGRKPNPGRSRTKTGNRRTAAQKPGAMVELHAIAGGKRPDAWMQPPKHLPSSAKDVWKELMADLALFGSMLRSTDRVLLEQLAVAVAMSRQLTEQLDREGLSSPPLLASKSVEQYFGGPHPLIDKLVKVNRQIMQIAERFGLDPLSRVRLGIEVLKGMSAKEALEESLADG